MLYRKRRKQSLGNSTCSCPPRGRCLRYVKTHEPHTLSLQPSIEYGPSMKSKQQGFVYPRLCLDAFVLLQDGTLDDAGLHPNSVVLLVEIESEDEGDCIG